MNTKIIRKHFFFKGRVQGVGFRYRAQNAASLYSVTGWVKNLYDGSVEMEAQGTEEDIDKVVQTLQDSYILLPVLRNSVFVIVRVVIHIFGFFPVFSVFLFLRRFFVLRRFLTSNKLLVDCKATYHLVKQICLHRKLLCRSRTFLACSGVRLYYRRNLINAGIDLLYSLSLLCASR